MPQLDLFAATPAAEDKNVRALEAWLNEHPGWHTAAEIAASLHGGIASPARTAASPITETSASFPSLPSVKVPIGADRVLRALAAKSVWIISGQKGYKHLARATPEEIDHFVNWMASQARQMTHRAQTVRQNATRTKLTCQNSAPTS